MGKGKWKLLGIVGVDSGQLMVCDPCYIKSEWKDTEFIGKEDVVNVKTGKKIKISNWDHKYNKKLTFNQALEKGLIKEIPYEETGEFSFDGCAKATLSKSFGQLNYEMGHEGVGVVFSSGCGDGTYEVWGKFENLKDWGTRITEVKIKMM